MALQVLFRYVQVRLSAGRVDSTSVHNIKGIDFGETLLIQTKSDLRRTQWASIRLCTRHNSMLHACYTRYSEIQARCIQNNITFAPRSQNQKIKVYVKLYGELCRTLKNDAHSSKRIRRAKLIQTPHPCLELLQWCDELVPYIQTVMDFGNGIIFIAFFFSN